MLGWITDSRAVKGTFSKRWRFVGLLHLVLSCHPLRAATIETYSAHLAALPRSYTVVVAPTSAAGVATEYNRSTVPESGWVTAKLDRNVLLIDGDFSGFGSAASSADLRTGVATGVGGAALSQLTVTNANKGKISGRLNLSKAQLALLRAGRLYVQISSREYKNGDIRGWLLKRDTVQ